jgi:type IV pilus assembly protein PilB
MGKRLKLGEMLVAKGLIDEAQLDAALDEQRRWGKRLGMTLVLMGVLEEEILIRTLAAQLKLPVARIRGKRVNAEVVELVPVELAEKHRCLPLFVKHQEGARELFLAMEDPSDLDAQSELGFRIGFRIRPVLVAPTELEEALQRHYHSASLLGQVNEPGDASDSSDALETDARRPREALTLSTPDPAELAERLRAQEPLPPQEAIDMPEAPDEPFEDTEPELNAPANAAAIDAPGDTQPDPPDIERAAAELGAFGAPEPPAAPAPARAAAQRTPVRADAPRVAAMSSDVILRALSQLLVEKGVLTRDELVERLRLLSAKEAGDGSQS